MAAATIVVLALSISACDGGQAPAARVNGHVIPNNRRFLESAALFTELTTAAKPLITPAKTTATSAVTTYVNERIDEQVLQELADENHIAPTPADLAAEEASIAPQVTGANGTKKWSEYPEWFRTQFVLVRTQVKLLTAKFAGSDDGTAAALAAYNANKSSFTKYCLSAVTTNTSAQAETVMQQLRAGTSFATIASQLKASKTGAAVGTKADGDLGCLGFSDLASSDDPFLTQTEATDLGASADGDLVGPWSVGPSYMVLKLRSRVVQPFAEVKAQIVAQLPAPGQAKFEAALVKALLGAHVEVNPRFGTWGNTAPGVKGVVGPTGADPAPGATTTTTTLAVGASSAN